MIAVAAVIGTVFLVSKISAGIAATIAAINTLIKAYNLLKASSIVAGVASAFALNPLLGVGAVAVAAAVLAGANALARSSDADTSGLGISGAAGFSGTMPNGQPFSTQTYVQTPAERAELAAALAAAGGGGGGVATVVTSAATVTKKAEQVVTDIAGAFDNFTSGTNTLAGVNAASNRPFAFGTSGVNTNTLAGIVAASGQPAVVINVNSPSIIDEEGFTRALNNAQNNSYFRGTGGATNLVGI